MSDNLYASPKAAEPVASSMKGCLWVLGIAVALIALILPLGRGRDVREMARRTQCKSNLKQIALALHDYRDVYDAFPPAYTVDSKGIPLHSWRTLILPYLEQLDLYKSIDLSKPWNDPANAAALKTVPSAYRCPSADLPPGLTTYLAVVGTDCCIAPTRPRQISEITDGTSNTLMVFEVAQENAVPWMAPKDADKQLVLSFLNGGTLAHDGGTQGLFVDGSARFFSRNMDPKTLRALITIAGDEVVGEF